MEDVRLSSSHNSSVKDTSSVINVIFLPSLNVVNLDDDSEGSLLEVVESVDKLASKDKPNKGRGGVHYLLQPYPPSLSQEISQSGGLGKEFFKESRVSKASHKSMFKLAQSMVTREVNQGKQSLIKRVLRAVHTPHGVEP
jgi:hypothetical protein